MIEFQKLLLAVILLVSILLPSLNFFIKELQPEVQYTLKKEVEYVIEGCDLGVKSYEESFEYDEEGKVLIVNIPINCCGVGTSIEEVEKTYLIYEKQYGELCKCICLQRIKVFDVEKDAKVVFVNKDGIRKIISPNLQFCGVSSYSECMSNEDCIVSGCSAQFCSSKYEPVLSTCEFRECFNHLKFGVECKCIDGMCQWD